MATTFLEVKNRAVSTLASAITDSDLSLDVAAGALFPSSYPFHITIDAEILSCTNRAANTLTVVRAQQGTVAVAHLAGVAVALNITAKSVSDLNTAVNTAENDIDTAESDIVTLQAAPPSHAASHEDTGGDEIGIGGLSGLAADDQHVLDSEAVSAVEAAAALNLGGTLDIGGAVTLGENSLILDHAVGTDLKWSGLTISGTAGATIAIGELCYLQDTDNEWLLTDADAEASAVGMLGIAISAGTNANPFTLLLLGFVRADARYAFAIGGAPLFVSVTPGEITATAPSATADIVRVIGYAHDDADTIYFNPSGTWVEIA